MQPMQFTASKACFKCGQVKPLTGFYKHKRMADGHLNKCKDCTRMDVKQNRIDNIDEKRAHDRDRGNRQGYEYTKNYRTKYPKVYFAQTAVGNAVRDGRIIKGSCEVCGSKKVVAHHDYYDRPLDVRWMCQSHHKQWHATNGEGQNKV